MSAPELVLASSSPRRRAFLEALGLPFRAVSADIDESPLSNETPADMTARLASAKADAVAAQLRESRAAPDAVVVAADTTVAIDGEILGKPVDADEARTMLLRLRNRSHQVISAVAVRRAATGPSRVWVNTATVYMRDYGDDEIAAYVATGDPLDKAGAYAVQHPIFAPAAKVDGCGASVVGLPLRDLVAALAEFDIVVSADLANVCERHATLRCCTRAGVTAHV